MQTKRLGSLPMISEGCPYHGWLALRHHASIIRRQHQQEVWEWVEIIEPHTKEHMYANLTTGECVWDPPSGVKIKKTDDNQWWELFDPNTSRFYYYNACSQQTVWHRPHNCDIIPLAKLQTLKQNTEVRDDELYPPPKREISTQTPVSTPRREHHVRTGSLKDTPLQPYTSPHPSRKPRFSRQDSASSHSSSSHKDSFREQLISADQIRRRGSQPSSHSSQSTNVGYSSSPSFHSGLARRESFEMPPRGHESPGLQRTHSAVHRSESSYSGGLPTRSASYKYPDVRVRDGSPVYSRDDSYLYPDRGRYHPKSYRSGTGSETYASRSDTYTPPFVHDSFISPPNLSEDGSLRDHHELVYSPVSVHSNQSSGYRENLYSPVLNMSKREQERTKFSPVSNSPSREFHPIDRGYSPGITAPITGPKDECIPFSQDIASQQGNISPNPNASKPKLRFPRTNPTYIGVHRRDGALGYKKINVDQSPLLEEKGASDGVNSTAMQTSQIHPEYFENSYFRHERSDSDGSYSSSRAYRHERTDSPHSSLRNRDLSDSQSSQGSIRNMSDMHSSEGSLRNMQDSAVSFQDSISSRGSSKSMGVDRDIILDTTNDVFLQKLSEVLDSDNEPEYANLPTIPSPAKAPEFPKISEMAKISELKKLSDYPLEFSSSSSSNNIEEINLRNVLRERNSNIDSDSVSEDMRIGDAVLRVKINGEVNGRSTDEEQIAMLMQTSQFSEDQGFEDTENANIFTSSPQFQHSPIIPGHMSLETQHASLKRKKNERPEAVTDGVQIEHNQSHLLPVDMGAHRPLSMVVPSQSEANMSVSPSIGSLSRQGRAGTCPPMGSAKNLSTMQKLNSDSDIENYAQQHLNKHKKGLFGKNVPLTNMLKWSKDPIQKAMLRTNDKNVKKEAVEVFKLIQMYMGDRKTKLSQSAVALEITTRGWTMGHDLRDEIFIQICRQTTENKKEDSLQRGWELMAVLLNFFPPTHKFFSYLEGYITRHMDPKYDLENFSYIRWCKSRGMPLEEIMANEKYHNVPIHHFAEHCQRRLEKMMQSGAKRGIRKPTLDEIEQAKKSIYCPSMFGSTLQDVMKMQRDHFHDRRLPWMQTLLSEWVLRLNGAQTEGIFRVPGDIDEVNALKIHCDQWKDPTDCTDPHIPASLLKLWYRELEEPLIPADFYSLCIDNYMEPESAVAVVNKLPEINRLVLAYLIRFLQVFAAPENALVTKMDMNNLAMVMAPNCLRCESEDPRVIFENTRKEMGFIRTLIQNLDTSFMEGTE